MEESALIHRDWWSLYLTHGYVLCARAYTGEKSRGWSLLNVSAYMYPGSDVQRWTSRSINTNAVAPQKKYSTEGMSKKKKAPTTS
jgi:hypothetical protein